jgi:hypothetical protein
LLAVNKIVQEKLAFGSSISGQTDQVGGGVNTSDVENNNRPSSDLARLTQQREMLLKSGCYCLADEIIRTLDCEIEEAKKQLKKA